MAAYDRLDFFNPYQTQPDASCDPDTLSDALVMFFYDIVLKEFI